MALWDLTSLLLFPTTGIDVGGGLVVVGSVVFISTRQEEIKYILFLFRKVIKTFSHVPANEVLRI